MAIGDLLWACPACGAEGALRPRRWGRGEGCTSCGSVLRRSRGSAIELRTPEGRLETRPAADWLDSLTGIAAGTAVAREVDVELRRRVGQAPIRPTGEYLNTIDRFGRPEAGQLELTAEALRFRSATRTEEWPLEAIAALGSSSKNLQLRIRRGPVLSIRFAAASVRFWEELLREALRERYRQQGRGEIVEFQPRILAR